MPRRAVLGPWLLSLLVGTSALALPPAPSVPAPLQPWVPWVLESHRDLLCAEVAGERECAWPGALALTIAEDGGRFDLDVWLDREVAVALPGDQHAWPLQVTVDGTTAPLQATPEGTPRLQLPAGHHKIAGTFQWASAPEVLAVPDGIGLVTLVLNGQRVEAVRRDEEGRLFLQKDAGLQAQETDTLTVAVARKLQDGVPLRETTRLTLRIAGRPRDVVLGQVLLAGARPVAVQSQLPVQVGQDGAVRVHAQPGTFTIDLDAVHARPEGRLAVPTLTGEFFEKQEVWVWQPAESVRSVELTGLQPVDPERTQLADDWKKAGRTFLGAPGQTLELKEMRRGETEQAPNRLELHRELWLDLDGQGLTARDKLTGELFQGWRLDAGAEMQLGRAADHAGNALLVTANPQGKRPGVELREGRLDLEADSRIAHAGHGHPLASLRVVGWDADVQKLQTTLHLPPGWQLLGASGIDQMPQTWLDSWTLLDFFFVLMVALGAGRLLGWPWGALALVGLVLAHGEDDAPQWLWLNALGALALLKVVPQSWFRKVVAGYHAFAVLLLLVVLLPFAAWQVRSGLYPQVEQGGHGPLEAYVGTRESAIDTLTAEVVQQDKAAEAPPPAAAAPAAEDAEGGKAEAKEVGLGALQRSDRVMEKNAKMDVGSGSYLQSQRKMQQIDPNAVVQTGPGVPRWKWTDVQLNWSGPVRKDHQASLWLLSPHQHLAVALLRALLLVVLGLRLLDRGQIRRWLDRLRGVPITILLMALLLPAVLVARPVHAESPAPDPNVLAELEKRLLAAQDCQGPCVVASGMTLTLVGQQLRMVADVSAQRDAAWVLPGPLEAWNLREVLVDGKPTLALRRLAGGLVAVRIGAGPHVISASGALARRGVLTLQLDPHAPPHHVTVVGRENGGRDGTPGHPGTAQADWSVDGLDPNGVPEGSLQLTRRAQDLPRSATPGDRETEATELPPWFQVERQLQLGLPWQVHTVVRRQVSDRPQLVKVRLLAGESVITEGVRVESEPGGTKVALVQMPRDGKEVVFDSELPVTPTISLQAPVDVPWTETWRLSCSPIWRCGWQGMAPVTTRDPGDQTLRPTWLPWPGERVDLSVVRPEGAPGQAVTVDRVEYHVTPGQRLLQASVVLQVRTSQGGWRTLTLPPGAEVQSVSIQGKDRTIRPQGRQLRVPLEPGAQTLAVKWQQPWQRSVLEGVPDLKLGGPATNVLITLEVGEDRWLLWTHGPDWGPAVLFWSHVLLVLLGAALLGRVQGPPLQTWQWALLGLGLVQLPAPALLLVVGWFLAMAWRRAYGLHGPPLHPAWHDVVQVGLAGWTLAFLGTLYGGIHANLLLDVDMQVRGAGSGDHRLVWYVDRTVDALPSAGILSLPLLVWRLLMLLWALWLVAALLRWLPWAWRALSVGGLWRAMPPRKLGKGPHAPVPPPPPPVSPPAQP